MPSPIHNFLFRDSRKRNVFLTQNKDNHTNVFVIVKKFLFFEMDQGLSFITCISYPYHTDAVKEKNFTIVFPFLVGTYFRSAYKANSIVNENPE